MNDIPKIMILGETATGKTSFISYFINNRSFGQEHLPTVGVETAFHTFEYNVINNKNHNEEHS